MTNTTNFKTTRWIAVGAAVIILAVVALAFGVFRGSDRVEPAQVLAQPDPAGFARVEGPQPLSFPADHGAHPEYQTEWWYYTGNLAADDGHHFGYQLTFFRRGLVPPSEQPTRDSDWATSQVYMAHFAVTDVDASNYLAQAKLSRGAAGLAGIGEDPLRVWLENWSSSLSDGGSWQLAASGEDRAIALALVDAKSPILEGDRGYSRKGSGPGDASMYYSQTRLDTTGKVTVGEAIYDVSGLSWMDHEFSTSALDENQVGWDWFALQLDNNSELMFYNMRNKDGTLDPHSSGTVIASEGDTTPLTLSDFSITATGSWKSPHSGAVYPAGWHIEVPSREIVLDIEPLVADQELNVSLTYWEGAVRITGTQGGKPVSGYGYVELTGYLASIAGQF